MENQLFENGVWRFVLAIIFEHVNFDALASQSINSIVKLAASLRRNHLWGKMAGHKLKRVICRCFWVGVKVMRADHDTRRWRLRVLVVHSKKLRITN